MSGWDTDIESCVCDLLGFYDAAGLFYSVVSGASWLRHDVYVSLHVLQISIAVCLERHALHDVISSYER